MRSVAAACYRYGFFDEEVAATEIDFITVGNYGICRFCTGSTVDTYFFYGDGRVICRYPERRGIYVFYLFVYEIFYLSIQCVNAFFQAYKTALRAVCIEDKFFALYPNLNADVFYALNHNVLGLVFKQNILSLPIFLLGVRGATIDAMVVPSSRYVDEVGVRDTNNDTVGPVVVLNGATRVELNNALLFFDIDNRRYFLIVNIFFVRKTYAAARRNEFFIEQVTACNAIDNNSHFLRCGVAECVRNRVNNLLCTSGHGIIIAACYTVGNVFRTDNFYLNVCANVAVQVIRCRCGGKGYLIPYVYGDGFFGRNGESRRFAVAYRDVELERLIAIVVRCVVCFVNQRIHTCVSGSIAIPRDFRLVTLRVDDVRFHFVRAVYSCRRDCDGFGRSVYGLRRELNAYGRRQNIRAEFRFVCVVNNQALQSHVVVVMGLVAAICIHREPACAGGFIPKLRKDFLGKRTLVDLVPCFCFENEVRIISAARNLVNPAVKTDCRACRRRIFTDILPL